MTNVSETQEVVIEITRELAKKGQPKSCRKCPIALAVNLHLREPYWCEVGVLSVSIRQHRSEFEVVPLPLIARKFIDRFDYQRCVDLPLTFPLSIPKQFLKESA